LTTGFRFGTWRDSGMIGAIEMLAEQQTA